MSNKKHFGICHICGKEKELTFEHIPPKKALNDQRAKVYKGAEMIKKYRGNPSCYINLQKGMGKYSLCKQCNNYMGTWYADAYGDFAKSVAFFLHKNKPLSHGSVLELNTKSVNVLAFIKQVISMFCSLIPYEEVERLQFNKLLLDKESNIVNTSLFDLRMYLTPISTGQLSSGQACVFIKKSPSSVECARIVDLAAYPFGFILNLSPEIDLKYGTKINNMLCNTYEKTDLKISLTYLERLNVKTPLPLSFKPVPKQFELRFE